MLPTRTLVVWCPDWPVAAAGVGADAPAAVFHANRVVASSAAARMEGVRRGLRRREAQARCPDLVVLAFDEARDARAFEPVVAAVEAFAPRVEVVRPGVCAVPTRGPSRYFGGDEALAAKVAAAVAEAGGPGCLTGIADGPFAAVLAARRGLVVPAGETAAFLASFPVTALDRPDLADVLTRLGIRTLGRFAALPAQDVLARFGADGAAAHRLARGLDERPLATRTPPPDLVVQVELDPPAQRVDTAAFAGKALADELHHRLASRGLACTRVAIEAETEHGERLSRLWRYEGALSASAIAQRVRWQLEGWLTTGSPPGAGADTDADLAADFCDPTAGITLLRLVPDQVVPDDGAQAGFWGDAAESAERASRVLARAQGLLGPSAVLTGVLAGGRQPLDQVELIPWGDAREPTRPPVPASPRLSVTSADPSAATEPAVPSPATVEPSSPRGPATPSRPRRRAALQPA